MNTRHLVAFFTLGMSAIGCGDTASDMPDIGSVSGTVLLDGEPVANATVSFYPTEGGRSSGAITDELGTYTLTYNRSVQGAKIGPHVVSVRTQQSEDGEKGSPDHQPATEETIPKKYRKDSVLKFDVAAGENSIDLILESE